MQWVWESAGLVCLIGGLFVGSLLTIFQLPGTWFILVSTIAYDWAYGFQRITATMLLAMGAVALFAELAEQLAAMYGAKRFGASRAASWGALLGGFAGTLLFAVVPVIPIPVVGSIAGGMLGCFVGAYYMECRAHGDSGIGVRVGTGAILGRLAGMMIKIMTAIVMCGAAIGLALRGMLSAGTPVSG